eukprot:16025323-Heterocapsa_arctica.AAC.1
MSVRRHYLLGTPSSGDALRSEQMSSLHRAPMSSIYAAQRRSRVEFLPTHVLEPFLLENAGVTPVSS